jgi:hypothetical protein
VVGGSANVSFFGRGRVGATAYWANTAFDVEGASLDFQEWSRFPRGGGFGAVGVDAQWGLEKWNFFLEVARSFDSIPGGGGDLGLIQRTVWGDRKKGEVELALRYYGRNFVNPYTRSMSGSDEVNGLRAINEAGARLRWLLARKVLRVRAELDVWAWPGDAVAPGTAGRVNLDATARADWTGLRWLELSGWLGFRDKDLGTGGPGNCFELAVERAPTGETLPCSGQQVRLGGRVEWKPVRVFSIAVQYQHDIEDDLHDPTRWRNDGLAYLDLVFRPLEELRLSWRTRLLDEDIADRAYLETSVWSYVDALWRPGPRLAVRGRVDARANIDDRASTASRIPRVEVRGRLDLEATF